MKKTRMILFFICIICAVFYIFTGSDFLFYFIIFSIIYTIASLLVVKIAGKNVDVKVSSVGQGTKGEPITLEITAKNKTFLPIMCLQINIKLENMLLETEEKKVFVTSLWPRETKKKELYVTENHIGCIRISVEDAESRDSLGIVSKKCWVTDSAQCLLFPSMSELHISRELFLSYDMESYRYSKTKKGADLSEVFDIREYRPGDSIKAIHWKLSAKSDSMIIKVPSLPVENSLMIILDNNLRGIGEDDNYADKIEQLVNFFLSISYTLMKQGLQHTIGWYEAMGESYEHNSIRSNDDLYNASASVIKAPFKMDKLNAAERFLDADFDKSYAAYIYVSCSNDAEKEVERLREYGEVYIYRPDNDK